MCQHIAAYEQVLQALGRLKIVRLHCVLSICVANEEMEVFLRWPNQVKSLIGCFMRVVQRL